MRGSFHILLLFLLVTGLAFAEASDSPKLSPEERTFTASKVYSLVRGYFFSANGLQTPGLDASYKTYLRTALTSDDRRRFDLATIEFVSQLHDGHTFFWDTWLDQSSQPLRFLCSSPRRILGCPEQLSA